MAITLSVGSVTISFGGRSDGDFAVDAEPSELAIVRQRLAPYPWTWLRQVHGAAVETVTAPGHHAGATADAAVTKVAGAVLAIQTADCVPVVFVGRDAAHAPVIGAAHAGWRGAEAGVLTATVDAMRSLGAVDSIDAFVGPCIAVGSYEFGVADLARLVQRFGPAIEGRTSGGTPALDMAAVVEASLAEAGVTEIAWQLRDTATHADQYSHRARADRGRQASVVWIQPAAAH